MAGQQGETKTKTPYYYCASLDCAYSEGHQEKLPRTYLMHTIQRPGVSNEGACWAPRSAMRVSPVEIGSVCKAEKIMVLSKTYRVIRAQTEHALADNPSRSPHQRSLRLCSSAPYRRLCHRLADSSAALCKIVRAGRVRVRRMMETPTRS